MTYRDPTQIDILHNEQLLWFTRRIVELEAEVERMKETVQLAEQRLRHERELADMLADVLRAVARGDAPFPLVARADAEEAARHNEYMLPLEQWKRARPHKFFELERTVREPSTQPWP